MSNPWTSTDRYFSRDHVLDPVQVAVGVLSACVCICCGVVAFVKGRHVQSYNATIAWLRGFSFFGACFVLAWATGVMDAVFFHPTVPSEKDGYIPFTIACFVVVLTGYWGIWPQGTVQYGRRRHLPCCVLFGLIDGMAESQVFLVIWAVFEMIPNIPRWGTA